MNRTIDEFPMMEPMKYYNNETECPKRREMLDNKEGKFIASEKHDGDWGMFIHWTKGKNLIRSRSISKVTGVYGDYTAKLPHLCEEMDNWPDNTVVLAEICWNEYGTNANTVGTILRCLPPKAIERQKEKKLNGLIFDILMYDGIDMTNTPYIDRIGLLTDEARLKIKEIICQNYFKSTKVFFDEFEFHATEIIKAGGEGLVIQKTTNPYMSGTRTAWATLKLKQKMESAEYQVIGVLEPKKYYEGIEAAIWKYSIEENGEQVLVTKPYYFGWKNGIIILLPSGMTTDVASGLTDEDREWLATKEAAKLIANGELYAEVAAMSINDKGALRHGYVIRLRVKEDGVNEL